MREHAVLELGQACLGRRDLHQRGRGGGLVETDQGDLVEVGERTGDDRDTAVDLMLPFTGPECSHDLTQPGTTDIPRRSEPFPTGHPSIVTGP